MRRWVVLAASAALVIGFCQASALGEGKKPKHSIKEVMKAANGKDGLLKKVTDGKADKKEKEQLLALYSDLWAAEPPKGEKGSWQQKVGDLVVAAAKVACEEEGALDALKAASNCKGCHEAHKKG